MQLIPDTCSLGLSTATLSIQTGQLRPAQPFTELRTDAINRKPAWLLASRRELQFLFCQDELFVLPLSAIAPCFQEFTVFLLVFETN